MAKCINCEQEATDQFCSHCGQRVGVKRITFKEGWYDFWARIYGFDGMFPRTLRDLTIRPGVAARTFISGNRAKYYGPVGYFFLMITIFLLLLQLLNLDLVDYMKEMSKVSFQPEIKSGSGQEKLNQVIMKFVSENFKWVTFSLIPFQALVARYLFFRKSGYNYVENAVLPFYTLGHVYWITIITIIIYKITGIFLRNSAGLFLTTTYFCFAYTNFITYQPKWKSFLKALGIYFLSLVLFGILLSIILFLVLYFNPDFLELIRPSNNR